MSPASWCAFDVPAQQREVERLEKEASQPGFWDDSQRAQATMRRLARLTETINRWQQLQERTQSSLELLELAAEDEDASLTEGVAKELDELLSEVDRHEVDLVLSGEYDDRSALVAIHAGAGGTDSQDWAEMLLRMYARWGERSGFRTDVLDISLGEEGGVKSVTLELVGPNAYGYAKAERGVHRLVRLSPFDADHLRHTSFALVEVLPEAEGDVDIVVNPDDLRMDVFKASGAGGQHVQKNSTAVRITHLPSGLVVSCQNERSQLQNKETALKILRARLMERELVRRAKEREQLKGEHIAAGWGNQIRSYVLHPYKLVKDHRTDFESTNPDAVLDGDLDSLIRAYLLSSIERD